MEELLKEQIDDMKENLERKEYLLQLSEQRSAAFEKLLLKMSDHNPEVAQKIAAQNILLKDRKITNVASENVDLKDRNTFLQEQNDQMREQLENVLARLEKNQGLGELAEEISIFQNKVTQGVQSQQKKQNQEVPAELVVKKESDTIKAFKVEINVLKKEIETLKDSNENHIFINELF